MARAVRPSSSFWALRATRATGMFLPELSQVRANTSQLRTLRQLPKIRDMNIPESLDEVLQWLHVPMREANYSGAHGSTSAERRQEYLRAYVVSWIAIVKLQRTFREQRYMFRAFGPLLFCRRRHTPADFGTIHFTAHQTIARFLTISSQTSARHLASFV